MPSSWLDVGLLSAFVCGYIWSQWICVEWKQSCSVGPLCSGLCLCTGSVNENRLPFFPFVPQSHLFKQKAERERELRPCWSRGDG